MKRLAPVCTTLAAAICLLAAQVAAATFSQLGPVSGGVATVAGTLGDTALESADIEFGLPASIFAISIADVDDGAPSATDTLLTTFDLDPSSPVLIDTGFDFASFGNDGGQTAFSLVGGGGTDPANVVTLQFGVPSSGSALVTYAGTVTDGAGTRAVSGDFTITSGPAAVIPLPGAVWGFGTALAALGALAARRRRA